MIYCKNCGRYICSSGINCCSNCGCRRITCVKSVLISGPQGIQGETVSQGIQGDSATNYTTANLSAIHTGGISLTVLIASK